MEGGGNIDILHRKIFAYARSNKGVDPIKLSPNKF